MSDHTIKINHGAAHVAIHALQNGVTSFDDIHLGGGVMLRLKAAKRIPSPEQAEKQAEYEERVETWLDSPLELKVDDAERDLLRAALKAVQEQKKLPLGPLTLYIGQLAHALGLTK